MLTSESRSCAYLLGAGPANKDRLTWLRRLTASITRIRRRQEGCSGSKEEGHEESEAEAEAIKKSPRMKLMRATTSREDKGFKVRKKIMLDYALSFC